MVIFMFAPFLPHFGKIVSMEKPESVDFTGIMQKKQKSHLPHFCVEYVCIKNTSNPLILLGFGVFLCPIVFYFLPSFLPHSAPFLPHKIIVPLAYKSA